MEEARSYWNMWTKRKNTLNSQVVASSTYGDSWEEQAFAEDAAGPLGGCIWPPRSYTCSFCRREFRSAQALGGHMNVHRRDRARLKQSPTPSSNILSPTTSLATQYPSQVRMLAYNKDSDHDFLAISPTRVSVPVAKMINCGGKALLAPSPSSLNFKEQAKRASILVSPPLWSNILDLDKGEKNLNFLDTKYRAKRDYAAADLAVSLNFVVCRKDQKTASSGKEDHDNIMSYKRRRVDDDATVSFFPKQSSVDRNIVYPQLEVIQVCPSSKEDLDLELRLGDRSA